MITCPLLGKVKNGSNISFTFLLHPQSNMFESQYKQCWWLPPSCVWLLTLHFQCCTLFQIFAAVDNFVGELSCKRSKNASLPDEFFTEVEQNLRQIVESTLKVYLNLVIKLNVSKICIIKHQCVTHNYSNSVWCSWIYF